MPHIPTPWELHPDNNLICPTTRLVVDWNNSFSDGLVAWYPGNEGDNGYLREIAYQNHGLMQGGTLTRSGVRGGQRMIFNTGSLVSIEADNAPQLDELTNGFTCAGWMWRSGTSGFPSLVDKDRANAFSVLPSYNATDARLILDQGGRKDHAFIGGTLVANRLEFFCFTSDLDTARLYKNGAQVGGDSTIGAGNTIGTSTQKLRIGCEVLGANTANIWVANIRLYKRALSAEEAIELYYNPWVGARAEADDLFYFSSAVAPARRRFMISA
ncbi:MAG: hypothetical protein HKM98_02495 [Gammaproteobacteria bacterium]|nr:hypothetical protein [Gammaproteobacteria bacterium]